MISDQDRRSTCGIGGLLGSVEDEPKKVGKDSGVGVGSGVVSVCWSRSAASSKKVPVDETNILVKKILYCSM